MSTLIANISVLEILILSLEHSPKKSSEYCRDDRVPRYLGQRKLPRHRRRGSSVNWLPLVAPVSECLFVQQLRPHGKSHIAISSNTWHAAINTRTNMKVVPLFLGIIV
jgi:hypothetical protein